MMPMEDILGVHKTYAKILNCFFWPNMKKDVAKFVHTCYVIPN